MTSHFIRGGLVVFLLIGLLTPALAQTAPAIEMQITHIDGKRGEVRCALYTKKTHLNDAKRVASVTATWSSASKAVCRFEGVRPGTYSLGFYHDEDGDGELDDNWFGIPKEGVGMSRDAEGTMGPPSFEDASFVHGDELTRLTAKMTYK